MRLALCWFVIEIDVQGGDKDEQQYQGNHNVVVKASTGEGPPDVTLKRVPWAAHRNMITSRRENAEDRLTSAIYWLRPRTKRAAADRLEAALRIALECEHVEADRLKRIRNRSALS